MSENKRKVENLLAEARRLQFSVPTGHKYDSVDLDDEALANKLLRLAVTRPLTLADLDSVLAQMEAEFREEIRREAELSKKCSERRDDLRVFYVYNTADNRLIVIARDEQCARRFAYHSGHIKDQANGRVLVLKPEREAGLRRSGKALGRALRDGYPGVVTEMGDNVVMESSKKVYTPMTIVE